jgi:hypothetical protein
MGNKSSNGVSQSPEIIAEEQVPELYKIIAEKEAKGELVELTRQALLSKNYALVDEYIQTRIPEFLLNEGKGEVVNRTKQLEWVFSDLARFSN